jgi:hypothetical protein
VTDGLLESLSDAGPVTITEGDEVYESYHLTASEELDAFAMPEEDEDYLAELSDEELGMAEDLFDLGEALRDGLGEDYEDATPEELEQALVNVMELLTPAESISFANALGQLGSGASRVVRDPTFTQVAGTALPVVGTALGGPVGAAVGSALGKAVTAAPAGAKAPSTPTTAQGPGPQVSGAELPAALRSFFLMNNPVMQKAALAAALAPFGKTSVKGFPVGALLGMLGSTLGEAAAEADELSYESSTSPAYLLDEQIPSADPADPGARAQALYAALLRAEDEELAEAVDW